MFLNIILLIRETKVLISISKKKKEKDVMKYKYFSNEFQKNFLIYFWNRVDFVTKISTYKYFRLELYRKNRI